MPLYKSTKTFGHELGLSCCFRQHRAESHCQLLHGYALAFKFTFASRELDVRNWVVDFGSLKSLRGILEDNFDHTLLVAEDDPQLHNICMLGEMGLAKVIVMPKVGCEALAEYVWEVGEQWIQDNGYGNRVWLESVEVSEHGANSAIYQFNA